MNFHPNSLFYEMVRLYHYKKPPDDKIVIFNEGGSRCFSAETLIITGSGNKPIKEISIGDQVVSFNESSNTKELKSVTNVIPSNPTEKKCVLIKLKNGNTVECTDDHKFFFKGTWVCIKDILSLFDGNMEANTGI